MWNRNNSFDYEDPSGFCTSAEFNHGCPNYLTPLGANILSSVYDAAVGHDLSNVLDSKSSTASRILSAALIVSNFVAPEKIMGTVAAKLGIKTISYAGEVLVKGVRDPINHGFSQLVDKKLLEQSTVTYGRNGYVQMSAKGFNSAGKSGTWELGGARDANGNLQVTHRFFRPDP
jgi:hypothetical protein